ncbi:hypothetical protein ACIP46_38880 [Streptomyces lavendulae]|uniref:hypothetical protein n=1 Tax=Streptomyces lavendulae TaxID=1914 RepID=UPI0038234031
MSATVRAFFLQMPAKEAPMTRDDALKQLSHIARERAFDRQAGSDSLIQAGPPPRS